MKVVVDNGNLKPFVNDPNLWAAFEREIQSRLETSLYNLAKSSDVHDMIRYQGRVSAFQDMLRLKEDINSR